MQFSWNMIPFSNVSGKIHSKTTGATSDETFFEKRYQNVIRATFEVLYQASCSSGTHSHSMRFNCFCLFLILWSGYRRSCSTYSTYFSGSTTACYQNVISVITAVCCECSENSRLQHAGISGAICRRDLKSIHRLTGRPGCRLHQGTDRFE